MAKMGRPKSENPKQNILTMRVTDQERDDIKAYAKLHDQSVTKVLLDGFRLLENQKAQEPLL